MSVVYLYTHLQASFLTWLSHSLYTLCIYQVDELSLHSSEPMLLASRVWPTKAASCKHTADAVDYLALVAQSSYGTFIRHIFI